MKKLLITILLICNISPAIAFENYMILSESPIKSVSTQNNIVIAKPIFTINNEKKIVILTPQKTGKTKIFIKLTDGNENIIEVKVTNKKTDIKELKGFEYFTMDMPPDKIDIPLPPKLGGNK